MATFMSQVAILPFGATAIITALPCATAVTSPVEELTFATAGALLVHVKVLFVALSGFTVAVNVSLSPTTSVSSVLLRVIPLTCTGAGSSLLH
jgi:hypothetical protein